MKIKIFLILLIPFILCGCYNYNELENLSICTAMAFDLEDDLYKVSYLIANAKKNEASSEKGEAQSVIYNGMGKSISEAVDDLITTIPHEPYVTHLKTIIISDELAKKGVQNILDFLLRYPESRNKFALYITDNEKAENTLKILSPIESFPSTSMLSNVKTSSIYQSKAIIVEYNDFVSIILEDGIEPILSSVKILGDIEEGGKTESLNQTYLAATLKTSNIGIFKDDKLLKISNNEETIGINFIKNKINELIIPIPCEDNYIILNTENSETKTNLDFKDNKFNINLDISVKAVINEVNCKIDLQNDESIKKIASDGERIINEYIEKHFQVRGYYPSVSDIASILEISESKVIEVLDITSNSMIRSLDEEINTDEKALTLLDVTAKKESIDKDIMLDLKEAFLYLSEEEKKLVIDRYYNNLTQSQVASLMGVNQVYVSRMEKRALTKMKSKMVS